MDRVDVLVVAALIEEYDVARDVGLAMGVKEWVEHGNGSPTPFLSCRYPVGGERSLSVALARPTRMGGRSTSPIATALTARLRPTCVAMCGVCAGNPADAAPGDVVVAEVAYEWDEGKQTSAGLMGDHRQVPMDPRWLRVAQDFSPAGLPSHGAASEDEAMLWLLERLHRGQEPRTHPARLRFFPQGSWPQRLAQFEAQGLIVWAADGEFRLTDAGAGLVKRRLYEDVDGPVQLPFVVRVAPMASGSAVVADAEIWDRLKAMGVRKVAAVEMEAATIATVAHEQQVPFWLVAKGVMDHADTSKDDRYKRFAARSSAEVMYALLQQLPFNPSGTGSGNPDPGGGPAREQSTTGGDTLNAYLRGIPAVADTAATNTTAEQTRRTEPLPPVWNLEARNPGFAGRDELLSMVHDQLHGGGAAVVQALRGMGGIGKTQLAIEYAYRRAGDYDLVWWIPAEQAGLIGDHFSDLGRKLGLVEPGADSTTSERVVKDYLRARDRWLLIFDNAESAQDIRRWLPGGAGHVLITSRNQRWSDLAGVIEVDVFPRAESMQLLTTHHPLLDPVDADAVADAVGDLPLALVQAASFLAETGMSATEYLEALDREASDLLSEGHTGSYDHTIAAVIAVSTTKLDAIDPAAMAVLFLCAFLAPEPVHPDLITAMATVSDDGPAPAALQPLAAIIDKQLARRRSLGRIGIYGLAKVTEDGVAVHRLVQAVLRDQLDSAAAAQLRARIEAVLSTATPGDPRDPASWPSWIRLMPHLLAADPVHTTNPALRQLARNGAVFLIVHGDARPARQRLRPAEWCTEGSSKRRRT